MTTNVLPFFRIRVYSAGATSSRYYYYYKSLQVITTMVAFAALRLEFPCSASSFLLSLPRL